MALFTPACARVRIDAQPFQRRIGILAHVGAGRSMPPGVADNFGTIPGTWQGVPSGSGWSRIMSRAR